MKSTICLFFILLISGSTFSQNISKTQDSIWTFNVSISQYPFFENNGCTPGLKVSSGVAKCNVISSNHPLKLSIIYVYNFSLIKRANNQNDKIVIRGRIRKQPVMNPGCLGKLNETSRMYVTPVFQQFSF